MKKRTNLILAMAILVAMLVTACGPAATPTPEPPPPTKTPKADVVLKITGSDKPLSWTEDELRAMETMEVEYTDADGTTTTYTGVHMGTLLKPAGILESIYLVLISGNGDEGEVEVDDMNACDNCIFAFDPEGGLRSVMPGFPARGQIKDVVGIRVWGTHD